MTPLTDVFHHCRVFAGPESGSIGGSTVDEYCMVINTDPISLLETDDHLHKIKKF